MTEIRNHSLWNRTLVSQTEQKSKSHKTQTKNEEDWEPKITTSRFDFGDIHRVLTKKREDEKQEVKVLPKSTSNETQNATMSFNPPQHTLYLNNLGASAIRNGDLDHAITVLAQALAAVKQRAHLNEEERSFHQHQEADLSEVMSHHALDTLKQPNSYITVTDNEAYVHRYPIELPTMEKDGEEHPISLMVTVQCMTILFNLALAFHLRGMRPSTPTTMSSNQLHPIVDEQQEREFALRNAIELYELCYEMMGSENMNPGLYFLMNLANNLGHCHGLLNIHDKSKKCFEHLLSMQMYMIDTIGFNANGNNVQASSSNESTVMTTAIESFFQNTSNLILNDCCASAA